MSDPVLPRGLVVSCQARPDNPLHGPDMMATMARAATQGGAVAIRADGPDDVAAIHHAVDLPIIGINKQRSGDAPVSITPTVDSATAVADAGAGVIAIDGTERARPDGQTLADLIVHIHDQLGLAAMADIDTIASARFAAACGADVLATTLAGYTRERPRTDGPDLDVLEAVVAETARPVVAEGRFRTPDQVRTAFEVGAHAVVIGTAITNPMAITRRFVGAVP